MGWAMAATLGLVVAEVFGGILAAAVRPPERCGSQSFRRSRIGISYPPCAKRARPADSEKTYGYHRAALLLPTPMRLSLFYFRSGSAMKPSNDSALPITVVESWMIWTSVAALAVNGGITLALVRVAAISICAAS